MTKLSKSVLSDINNSLKFFYHSNVFSFTNRPILQTEGEVERITWPNHFTGGTNKESYFGKISQYRGYIISHSFHALMFDGSVIRTSFTLKANSLTSHSLWYWPSPFDLEALGIDNDPPLDIVDAYIEDKEWHNHLQMRTPIRIDYDRDNATIEHPLIHMHMQNTNCRLKVQHPMCFSRFMKFILDNFYPDKTPEAEDWNSFSNCFEKHKLPDQGHYLVANRLCLSTEPQDYPAR